MKAADLFSAGVVLGVFHKLRAQDVKVLARPSLEGLPRWDDMRMSPHSEGFQPLGLVM